LRKKSCLSVNPLVMSVVKKVRSTNVVTHFNPQLYLECSRPCSINDPCCQ
jgi:hypothetical protein